jgi:tryptophan-rich sensory protein
MYDINKLKLSNLKVIIVTPATTGVALIKEDISRVAVTLFIPFASFVK